MAFLPWGIALLGGEDPFWFSIFKPLCHQRVERSLSLNGILMVVCSRCAGIYAGMILGSALAGPLKRFSWLRKLTLFSAALMLVEVAAQELGLHPIWHTTRFASGFLLSFFATAWLLGGLLKESQKWSPA